MSALLVLGKTAISEAMVGIAMTGIEQTAGHAQSPEAGRHQANGGGYNRLMSSLFHFYFFLFFSPLHTLPFTTSVPINEVFFLLSFISGVCLLDRGGLSPLSPLSSAHIKHYVKVVLPFTPLDKVVSLSRFVTHVGSSHANFMTIPSRQKMTIRKS